MTPTEIRISAVVPVVPGDLEWPGLLDILGRLEQVKEILLSVADDADAQEQASYREACDRYTQVRTVSGFRGRAFQINRAIRQAKETWIWVLHADSRFAAPALLQLQPGCLHYCSLAFRSPAPLLMPLNAWGACLRSDILGMPFGDQSMLFEKAIWRRLGGFSERAMYGEDHLFVWKWRQAGLALRKLPLLIETSARKYTQKGWYSTSSEHLYYTWKQALPEFAILAVEGFLKRILTRGGEHE